MRWLIRKISLLLTILVVLLVGYIVVLAITVEKPRSAPEWNRLNDLPRPRGEFAAAFIGKPCAIPSGCTTQGQKIYVTGGLSGFGRASKDVDVYDVTGDTWTRGPNLPEVRHHPGAAGIGNVVYVSGGAKSATNWKPENNLWALKPGAKSWESLPDMPEGRMAHQMVAVGGKLYVIGGRGATSNVLIFDPAASKWSIGAQMPGKRDHLAAAVVGTKIYAIGGRDSDLTSRVDIYDTKADAWSEGPKLPIPMSAMAAGWLSDGIHVVGGENPSTVGGGVLDHHYRLATGGTTWDPQPKPILAVHGAASLVADGQLIIIGGARRQGTFSVLGWTGLVEAYGPQLG
jgi:N-acetylneuraminic acid mutarotase